MLEGRGMDFETIGFAQGMGDAFRNLEREATQRIEEANATIHQLAREKVAAEREVAQLKAALALEQAGRAGVLAQAKALKAEVCRIDPTNLLLRGTGKKFEGGELHRELDVVFEKAFDAKAVALGFERLKDARPKAK